MKTQNNLKIQNKNINLKRSYKMQLSYKDSGLHIEPFFKFYDLLPLNLKGN